MNTPIPVTLSPEEIEALARSHEGCALTIERIDSQTTVATATGAEPPFLLTLNLDGRGDVALTREPLT